jgi:glycosyltransferase involved in cell wall biosynthesis
LTVLHVNFDFDRGLSEPDELLDRYSTLTGWSEALLGAGAARVVVLQRFHRTATVTRNGVDYRFVDSWRVAPPNLESIGIAHVNGLHFPGRTRLLRARLRREIALVVQDHAGGPPPVSPISRALRRAAHDRVDAFLFTVNQQAEPWRAAGLIGPHQAVHEVLEASTDLRPVDRASARAASGVDGTPAVLWVGRLNENKDPLTVLAGFERLLDPFPAATLTMAFGSDDLLPAVNARVAASAALRGRVRLVGYVPRDRLAAYYSAADLFVLGSHHEGSGYALIEACACGAVPVVTNIPPFRLITANGAVGALWQPADVTGLGRALVDMAFRDLGAAGAAVRGHFTRNLSWAAVGARAMAIYAEVRARRQGSL